MRQLFASVRRFDWPLVIATVFLVAFGLMGIYSIEAAADNPVFDNFNKQLLFAVVGVALFVALTLLDYRYLRQYSWVLYGLGVLALVAVLIFGTTIRGTRGWFTLFGGIVLQPVELVKILFIVAASRLLSGWQAEIRESRRLLLYLLVMFGLAGLVFLQPDFGSAFILLAFGLGYLFMVKIKRSYLVILFTGMAVVAVVSWFFVLQPYQQERLMTFIDPDRDPYESGYNIKQSIIAVGSGNFFGRGLSLGPQSRLNFLPAQETDFIFAVIAEELGLVGAGLLLALLFFLMYRLVRMMRLARDDFGYFIIMGIVLYFLAQSILNIGMNIGLVPIAGVPLPLVSYGGSSLVASLAALGIAHSIYVRRQAR